MEIAFCCAQIRDTIMWSDRDKSLTVSITDLSKKSATLHLTDTSNIAVGDRDAGGAVSPQFVKFKDAVLKIRSL